MKNVAWLRRMYSLSAICFSAFLGYDLAKGRISWIMYNEACVIVFFILVILCCTIWKEK